MSRKSLFAVKLAGVAALAALMGSVALAGPAAAEQGIGPDTPTAVSSTVHPAAGQAVSVASRSWSLTSDWHSGDCTMFHGASWTLSSDGTMKFDGVVTSSDDNDAWLMWVNVYDTNGANLGRVTNSYPQTQDWTEFIQGLSNHNLQYHWLAYGHFDPNWYPLIGKITIDYHC